jgi:hypothetical protein
MTRSIQSRVFAAIAMVLVTAGAGRAMADETPPPPSSPPPVGGSVGYFGERGQIALSGDNVLSNIELAIVHSSVSMNRGSTTAFAFQPALDYFVSPNVSVGGVLGIVKATTPFGTASVDATSVVVGARAGYNVVLSSAVTLWIRAGFEYRHDSFSLAGTSSSGYSIPFVIFAPVLWHPAPHFFVGAGPAFSTELVSKTEVMNTSRDNAKTTDFGIASTLGGYFGGL